jgi:hypothetical protein
LLARRGKTGKSRFRYYIQRKAHIAGCHHLKEKLTMTGIQYVTDDKGRKVAVQIELKQHRELWEDIEDVLASRSRRQEKRIPIEQVKARLIKRGKLREVYE